MIFRITNISTVLLTCYSRLTFICYWKATHSVEKMAHKKRWKLEHAYAYENVQSCYCHLIHLFIFIFLCHWSWFTQGWFLDICGFWLFIYSIGQIFFLKVVQKLTGNGKKFVADASPALCARYALFLHLHFSSLHCCDWLWYMLVSVAIIFHTCAP